jgi:hypothetical protein
MAKTMDWKSRKLTNGMRADISRRLERALTAANTMLPQQAHALGVKVYDHIVPQEHQRAMARLPADFFETTSSITVQCGRSRRINLGKTKGTYMLPAYLRYAYNFTDLDELPQDLQEALKHHRTTLEEFTKCVRQVVSNADSLLNQATTEARLLELWPEAITYLMPPATPTVSDVPAVVVPDLQDTINQILGLAGDAKV